MESGKLCASDLDIYVHEFLDLIDQNVKDEKRVRVKFLLDSPGAEGQFFKTLSIAEKYKNIRYIGFNCGAKYDSIAQQSSKGGYLTQNVIWEAARFKDDTYSKSEEIININGKAIYIECNFYTKDTRSKYL